MKYDTIIVGGGIAGLTSAAYLSKAGQKVLLLEKQEYLGGQVQTFWRNGFAFDTGLRSIENSGTVFPMLKQLGIDIDFVKSKISVGIADKVLVLEDEDSLIDYEIFLAAEYPGNIADIKLIIEEIKKVMGYMEVLYGIDNPAFMDIKADKAYLFKEMLPWMLRFLLTMRKIKKLNDPIEEYLKKFSSNQALIDIIAQHFFKHTPASFALSYFSLYLDYYYPKGGTGTVINKIANFIKDNGGTIKTNCHAVNFNPETKELTDSEGNTYSYNNLVWAADLKLLYNQAATDEVKEEKLKNKIIQQREFLKDMRGSDSIFAVYLSVDMDREYFAEKSTGHFFYTPDKRGLSSINDSGLKSFMKKGDVSPEDNQLKEEIMNYCREFCDLNTFEIAMPNLRDPELAPKGKSGLIVSLLFDYSLAKKLDEVGWLDEARTMMEKHIIKILDETIYPGLLSKVIDCFSSTPVTIERRTNSAEGAITGWAFDNPVMPAENGMLTIAKSVDTILPGVYQAGQWTYSPAGFPISVLTGKLAADKVLKSADRK